MTLPLLRHRKLTNWEISLSGKVVYKCVYKPSIYFFLNHRISPLIFIHKDDTICLVPKESMVDYIIFNY